MDYNYELVGALERVYDRIREMHYSLECHENKMRLEQFLKEEGAK